MSTLNVGSGQVHKTISSALNSARDGDEIIVYAGEYYEQVKVHVPNVTIKNNPGDSPSVTGRADEHGVNSGLPSSHHLNSKLTGRTASYEALVGIYSNGVTWKGVDVINGRGNGIGVMKGTHGTKVLNCKVTKHHVRNLDATGDPSHYIKDLLFDGIESTLCGMWQPSMNRGNHSAGTFMNWPVNASFKGVDGLTIRNCLIHHNWGGGIIVDGNRQHSKNILIEDNTVGNQFASCIYVQAASNAIVQRNVLFQLKKNPHNKPGAKSLSLGTCPNEQAKFGVINTTNVKFINNIIVNCGSGLFARRGGDGHPKKTPGNLDGIIYSNNTIINCGKPLTTNSPTVKNSKIEKNIFANTGKASGGNPNLWHINENYWQVPPASGYKGRGDKVGSPGVANPNFVPTSVYTVREQAIAAAKHSNPGWGADFADTTLHHEHHSEQHEEHHEEHHADEHHEHHEHHEAHEEHKDIPQPVEHNPTEWYKAVHQRVDGNLEIFAGGHWRRFRVEDKQDGKQILTYID